GPYGQAPYVAGPYGNTNPYGAGQPGRPQAPGQFDQNPRNTGSWQAADPAQGPDWAARQAPQGPGAGPAGGWQAGAGFGATPRDTGSWRGARPEQGQGWAHGPGGGPGVRPTGARPG